MFGRRSTHDYCRIHRTRSHHAANSAVLVVVSRGIASHLPSVARHSVSRRVTGVLARERASFTEER